VRVADLQVLLDRLVPWALAEPGDNCGLLVGAEEAAVRRILVALELTEAVLQEAVDVGCDVIITHHPLLYTPLRSLVESRRREALVRRLVGVGVSLFACHTNLDAAPGGLADICARELGLGEVEPLQRASAGWCKLVGFVPPESVEAVAAAVFAGGAGRIGEYRDCAFAAAGTGWFTPEKGAHPTVGSIAVPEKTPEIRWETVVPRARVAEAVSTFIRVHPYEEPAFDIYAVDDVIPGVGLGRSGVLGERTTVAALAQSVKTGFALRHCEWSGDGARPVRRVAVLPGSGRSLIDAAALVADVLITGDLGYHDAERAGERGLALIAAPHEDLEWWALRRWADGLRTTLSSEPRGSEVDVVTSRRWQSPWTGTDAEVVGTQVDPGGSGGLGSDQSIPGRVRLRVDGGSRGNPGPSAIGVVMEDVSGQVLQTLGRAIGRATNNVAEYRALIEGLKMARAAGAAEVEVLADSELLVKQMRGEYRVKNEGLKPLHAEATALVRGFVKFSIRHVPREENAMPDRLLNEALDGGGPLAATTS
jgi:dinuclear metal center YbgI/SA1388 family protein